MTGPRGPSPRLNLGTFNVALAAAIAARDLRKIRDLADHARACGMNYNELSRQACACAKIEPAEWESILYDVDTAESEE